MENSKITLNNYLKNSPKFTKENILECFKYIEN